MSDGTDDSRLPSKKFLALLYLPLMIPAVVPIWMARDQDDPVILAIMFGTSVAILIGNAFMLVLLYRWFERSDDS